MAIYRMKCIIKLGILLTAFIPTSCMPLPSVTSKSIQSPLTSAIATPRVSSIVLTITPRSTSTQNPRPTSILGCLLPGGFPIPYESNAITPDLATVRSFMGFMIPPLPSSTIMEFQFGFPGGEAPGWLINYDVFLIRQGNARMLWLGIPFRQTLRQYRIYDAIPLPPIKAGDALIPYDCFRKNENEPYQYFFVIADCSMAGSPSDIQYAWRIDPASTSLQPVSTEGIVCW
jgi:hypothetical protein